LSMVADGTVDLVFSFDSLVHVEADVLVSYIEEIGRKLTPNGVGFLHHSNLAEFVDGSSGAVSPKIANSHNRALSVSSETVREACDTRWLICVSQELLNWVGTD